MSVSKKNEAYFKKLNWKAPQVVVPPPGPRAQALLARQKKVDSNALVYPSQIPLAPEQGLGATLRDADQNTFIDFSGGVGVLNVGHSNPKVVEAIKDQADRLTHALDFPGLPRVRLSEKLVEIAPGDMRKDCRVFLSGPTGADAVEAAVKLGKFYSGKPGVISFEGGWHGVTGAGLAATGKRGAKERFLPLMPEVYIIPYPYCYRCVFDLEYPHCDLQCAKYLEHIVRDPDSGATSPGSILIEPIQGEGGIVVPMASYLQEVRRIATQYGLVLIMDEIQTGFARTGRMFCCERAGVTPDIMTVSKTMGGGLPLAAVLIKKEFDTWPAGAHVGTFRGNLLSCAAGLAAIDFIETAGLVDRAEDLGRKALERLKIIARKSRFIGDLRGQGLYIGAEFVRDKLTKEPAPDLLQQLQERCFQKGLILWKGGRWNNVARFLPALVITEELLLRGIDIFEKELKALESRKNNS